MSLTELPLVTIVMPVTKTRFLDEAIESALEQSYPALEVIALDDGSSDEAMPALLEGFAERAPERFRFVRHDNVGQSQTINRGIELAAGTIAGYLSDDDLLRPDAVSRLVEVLQDSAVAVVAYPDYEIIDEWGNVVDSIAPLEYSLRESARLHDSIVGAGALFRVDAFRQVGGWDADLRYRADYDFWLRLASLGDFGQVREPLASWRYHPGSGSVAGVGLPMAHESLRVLDKLFEQPALAPELEEVRAEAYRNAFVQAALALRSGGSGPGERFYVFDRHMPAISRAARESSTTPDALLNAQVAHLDREITGLRELLAQREELVAMLERPWWWRASRRLVPAGLRPWAKRLARRLRPGFGE